MGEDTMEGRVPLAPGSREPGPRAVPALTGFDPSRWVGDRYSPNLNKWLARQARRSFGEPTVYRENDGTPWIGWIDDLGWFLGCRLMRCLTVGVQAGVFAFSSLGRALTADDGFWCRYDAVGRCAIDEKHTVSFIGDQTRWAVDGDTRSCLWCGDHQQQLHRWSETIQHESWVPRDSDGSGEAGETRSGSTEGDSAGPQGIAQSQDTSA